jgi:hypothetical protein
MAWIKEEEKLKLEGFEDVTIEFEALPYNFVASIGDHHRKFEQLNDAMLYAETLAEDRKRFQIDAGLPLATEASPTREQTYLEKRGLA